MGYHKNEYKLGLSQGYHKNEYKWELSQGYQRVIKGLSEGLLEGLLEMQSAMHGRRRSADGYLNHNIITVITLIALIALIV